MSTYYEQELQYADDIEVIKEIQHECICKEHHLRTRLNHDFDEYGTNVYIVKCCCLQFAKEVAATLIDSCPDCKVYLEPKTGLTTVRQRFSIKH